MAKQITKIKKILFFAVLFFLIIFLSLPNITIAATASIDSSSTTCGTSSSAHGWCNTGDQNKILALTVEKVESGDISALPWTGMLKAIPIIAGEFVIYIASRFAALATILVSYIIGVILSAPITNDQSFTPAWVQVRNLGNMVIVLGFVVVGIATALRIRTYEAKKLMWPLIAAALLINFSGLFCGLIIDAGNLVTGGLVGSTGLGMMPFNITKALQRSSLAILTTNLSTGDPFTFMFECIEFSFVYVAVGFTFLYMSVLLIARYAILVMLYILSPLAFSFWIFPASQKLWSEWWNHFLKWCFIGVYCSFALWMATVILNTQTLLKTASPSITTDGDFTKLSISCTLVLMFLFVGLSMASKSSGIASSAVMGLAVGAAGLAAGAVGGGAKLASRLTEKATGGRVSGAAAGQAVSNAYGRTMERIGLRQTGTTASANSKQVESEAALMSKEYTAAKATGDTASVKRIQRLAVNGRGASGAAAMKVVTDAKDLNETFKKPDGKVDYVKANGRLSYAESSGATNIRSEAGKYSPTLEKYNPSTIKKIKDQHPGWSDAQAGHEAVVRAVAKMPEESLDRNVVESISHLAIRDAGDRMSDKKKETFKKNNHKEFLSQYNSMPTGPEKVALGKKVTALGRL